MSDNAMWSVFWGGVATVLATLIASITMYLTHIADIKLEMVSQGASPLEVQCAFSDYVSERCAILALKKQGE